MGDILILEWNMKQFSSPIYQLTDELANLR